MFYDIYIYLGTFILFNLISILGIDHWAWGKCLYNNNNIKIHLVIIMNLNTYGAILKKKIILIFKKNRMATEDICYILKIFVIL